MTNKPIFELDQIKIYESGEVIGYNGSIINRIPNIIMKVELDSWNAAIEAAAIRCEDVCELEMATNIRMYKK